MIFWQKERALRQNYSKLRQNAEENHSQGPPDSLLEYPTSTPDPPLLKTVLKKLKKPYFYWLESSF
jgi:hypothetical protein